MASNAGEGGSLDELTLELLANEIYKCVCKDDPTRNRDQYRKARSLVQNLSLADRQRIVSYTFEGKAPLFEACRHGKTRMAMFLLDDCNADIEQKGIYEVEDNDELNRHEVSPLWCAAVANKLDIVKLLIERGANINCVSDTQSTPVRSACYMTNVEIVKYLVLKGADIHKPNVNGGTCLINSVQSLELSKFLIDHSCDVNARDCAGNLALHYAIREGRLETVKLLIAKGSDTFARNDVDEDALLVAALRGWKDILEYLINVTNPEKLRVVESYELLAAQYVDERNNLSAGIELWKRALQMRNEPPCLLPKEICNDRKEAYLNGLEANSIEEYDCLAGHSSAVYVQALLTRERILGASHKETLFGIVYRGAAFADNHEEEKCVALWLYALEIHVSQGAILDYESEQTILALTKIFLDTIDREQSGEQAPGIVKLPTVMRTFTLLTNKIKTAVQLEPLNSEQRKGLETLLKLSLQLVTVFMAVAKTENEIATVKLKLREVIALQPKAEKGYSLLHLAVLFSSSHVSEEFFSYFPNISVLDWLLECGANVNALDNDQNTAFMLLLLHLPYPVNVLDTQAFVKKFLDSGVHVDVRNKSGQIAGDILSQGGVQYPLNKRLTLKCWAARAVRKHGIVYENEIPKSLVPFVNVH